MLLYNGVNLQISYFYTHKTFNFPETMLIVQFSSEWSSNSLGASFTDNLNQ